MGRVARTKAVIYSPPTETELRLQELQEKFLDPNGCSKADKDEFFLVMRMYARSITLQMIKSKGLVLPPERVDEVCTDATLAILKQYQKLLAMDEVDLEFEEGALHAIAKKAKEKKVGARALRAIIEEFMLDIMYEIPKDDNIGKVTITEDYVEKKGGPLIQMRGVAEIPERAGAM